MSKYIKFRVWHKQNKVMMWLKQIVWFPDREQRITAHPFDQREPTFVGSLCHLEIMEYTGIDDKNGKEIYEGDILDVDEHKRLCKVIWFEPQACFDTVPIKVMDKHTVFNGLKNSEWSYRTEVVGNIYENPELLKQEG